MLRVTSCTCKLLPVPSPGCLLPSGSVIPEAKKKGCIPECYFTFLIDHSRSHKGCAGSNRPEIDSSKIWAEHFF